MTAAATYATRVVVERRWANPPEHMADHPDVKDWSLVACFFDVNGVTARLFHPDESPVKDRLSRGFPEDLSDGVRYLLNIDGWEHSIDRKVRVDGPDSMRRLLDELAENGFYPGEFVALRHIILANLNFGEQVYDVRVIAYSQVVAVD